MVGYGLYWRDPIKGYQLVGVLPERRRRPKRITKQSVLNWAEKYFATNMNLKEMFFLEVRINGESIRAYSLRQKGSQSTRRKDSQRCLEEMYWGRNKRCVQY